MLESYKDDDDDDREIEELERLLEMKRQAKLRRLNANNSVEAVPNLASFHPEAQLDLSSTKQIPVTAATPQDEPKSALSTTNTPQVTTAASRDEPAVAFSTTRASPTPVDSQVEPSAIFRTNMPVAEGAAQTNEPSTTPVPERNYGQLRNIPIVFRDETSNAIPDPQNDAATMKMCTVCTKVVAKYKTSCCITPYCSSSCFKIHTASCDKQKKRPRSTDNPISTAKLAEPQSGPPQTSEHETVLPGCLSTRQLRALESCTEIKKLLESKELRELIINIDSAEDRILHLDKARQNIPDFAQFSEMVLDVLTWSETE